MRCKVVGNSIDEVYEAIIALKSRHGSNNVIVDQSMMAMKLDSMIKMGRPG